MSPELKNGKLHTINIYCARLIFLFIYLLIVSASPSDVKHGKDWVIVIDPGHGGRDPGALGSFSYEKNITLAIALKTGEYIEQNIKNVKVLYTRKNDSFVELKDRAVFANKNNADLFISIHANLSTMKNVQGTETYIMGITKDDQNLAVAMKENEVIMLENDYSTKYEGFDPKSPESYIMFSLMQNIYKQQSTALASKIQTQFKDNINRIDRGVKQAGFWVLYMTTMPSVLTETGFISNPNEEKYLNSKAGQDYIALSIFKACSEYINEIDSKSVVLSDVKNNSLLLGQSDNQVLAPVDSGILFKVQIATSVSKIDLKPENFKGLEDISEINSQNRFKYVTGSFTDYSEAVKCRRNLTAVYPDAFVIAIKNNKILPLQQALDQIKKNKHTP